MATTEPHAPVQDSGEDVANGVGVEATTPVPEPQTDAPGAVAPAEGNGTGHRSRSRGSRASRSSHASRKSKSSRGSRKSRSSAKAAVTAGPDAAAAAASTASPAIAPPAAESQPVPEPVVMPEPEPEPVVAEPEPVVAESEPVVAEPEQQPDQPAPVPASEPALEPEAAPTPTPAAAAPATVAVKHVDAAPAPAEASGPYTALIVSHEERMDRLRRSFVVYTIDVKHNGNEYTVHRRYSQFLEVAEALQEAGINFAFPPKAYFVVGEEFHLQRRNELQSWLDAVAASQHTAAHDAVIAFLERGHDAMLGTVRNRTLWNEWFGGLAGSAIQALAKVPGVGAIVDAEKQKYVEKMRSSMHGKGDKDETPLLAIAEDGMQADELLQMMAEMKKKDMDYMGGKTMGFVYHGGAEHSKLMAKVYEMFSHSNPLHTSAFPCTRQFEAEVVRMTCTMLNGDRNSCGTTSSGGTESILLASKAYRDWSRVNKPGIKKPEMVMPITAHAAWNKACQYFGIKEVMVPVNPVTMQPNVHDMMAACTKNTVVMVLSAPQYPHGVFDPIEELAAMCQERGIPVHVDACLGGFMSPWAEKLGYKVPLWDYRVPGVMSISADVHKYGFAPKGCSCITYRNSDLRFYQFFSYANWPGGLIGSPTIAGSRPGALIATAWAALKSMGQRGYIDVARQILSTAEQLRARLATDVPEVAVNGKPMLSVFSIRSTDPTLDIFKVGDRLEHTGWFVERQQFPNSLHISVTLRHINVVDQFIAAVRAAIEYVRVHPDEFKDGMAAVYGKAPDLPDRALVSDLIKAYLEMLYDV